MCFDLMLALGDEIMQPLKEGKYPSPGRNVRRNAG